VGFEIVRQFPIRNRGRVELASEVNADGYAPLSPDLERSTGLVRATLMAQATVTVPESGVVPSLKLKLKKPVPPAKRFGNSD
jgi:hypothetical protein